MVKHKSSRIDRTFAALADPTRRGILQQLAESDRSLSDLAAPFDMSLPAVMKHVGVLERAGLLTHDKQGRVRRCHLEAAPLREAADWIERYRVFWTNQLDALSAYFEASDSESKRKTTRKPERSKGDR